ncbi:hypothetical protein AB0M20_44195 [Actinoplanes sp. NPDC051633]|uniref:hypothetical protein n=1 Tax=Actinoplanes sp. NPDC051633 TaxID=3155670 RepID=UPI00343F8758
MTAAVCWTDDQAGAQVVVDVLNAPTLPPAEVRGFFTWAGRTLVAAEVDAGVAQTRPSTSPGRTGPR